MKDEEILKEVLKDYVAGEDYEFRCGIEKAITLKGQAEAQKLQKIKEELKIWAMDNCLDFESEACEEIEKIFKKHEEELKNDRA
jgi:hypothetical protein